jgi:PKD repeat protein
MWRVLAVVVGLIVSGGPARAAPASGVLWGADGAGAGAALGTATSNLLRIDPATGAATPVGPVGYALTALAVDPTTGILYGGTGTKSAGSANSLVRVDRTTGVGTLVGVFGNGLHFGDLAFDAPGQLYSWADDLYTVDKATGADAVVGNSTIHTQAAALAFCGNTLYFADATDSDLRIVDKAAGTIVLAVGTLGGAPGSPGIPIAALACRDDGTLFATVIDNAVDVRPAYLVTIDRATAAVTTIGRSVDKLDALAFDVITLSARASPGTVLPGQPITFSATASTPSGTALTYLWDFGDGSTGTGATATHTYATAAPYTVTMTARDAFGAQGTDTIALAPPRQILWGVDGAGRNPDGTQSGHAGARLHRIDVATGTANPVGPVGFAVTGLAVDPVTNVLYGATARLSPAAPFSLVRLDRATGAGTLVTPFSSNTGVGTTLADIAFDDTGQLWGWNRETDDLYRVDATTGVVTRIGASGLSTSGCGLAFAAGARYIAGEGNDGPLRLVDRVTGTTSVVGMLTGAPGPSGSPVSAMAARADGTLFGVVLDARSGNANVPASLVTIDRATAAVATIGRTVNRLDAIAFEPLRSPTVGVTASPDPALAGAPVTFTAGATSPSGFAIAYAWDFGDGTTGAGAEVAHVYATPGPRTVVVTVTDENGATATAAADVEVQPLPPPALPLTVRRLVIALDFRHRNRDTILLAGRLPVPKGFAFAGRLVTTDVGGIEAAGSLDARGKTRGFSIKRKSGAFRAKLRGSFAAALADDGLTNTTVRNRPVIVPVTVGWAGQTYAWTRTALYSARAGRHGKAR